MESKDFKDEPTHVRGETYIDPDRLLRGMADKYGRGNFRIKLRCGIYSIYLRREVDDQEFTKDDWLSVSVDTSQSVEENQLLP